MIPFIMAELFPNPTKIFSDLSFSSLYFTYTPLVKLILKMKSLYLSNLALRTPSGEFAAFSESPNTK